MRRGIARRGALAALLISASTASAFAQRSASVRAAPERFKKQVLHSAQDDKVPGYELVWADEFSRDGWPDPRNWTYERGFVRNRELQWYQADNATVQRGLLIIEARREQRPNPTYESGSTDWKRSREQVELTSSSLTTRARHSWRYGRFEMRARIDVRPGMWPAFWTVGDVGR